MAAINVEKLSLKELIALEAKVASAISAARDRGRADIKQKVAELAKTHGFSVSELFGGVRGRGDRARRHYRVHHSRRSNVAHAASGVSSTRTRCGP